MDRAISRAGKTLQYALAEMMKGELGMRLTIWRAHVAHAAKNAAVLMEQGKTEELRKQMMDKTMRRAGRTLQYALAEATKGELGLRITIWRTHVAHAAKSAAVLLEQMKAEELRRQLMHSKMRRAGTDTHFMHG